MSLTSYLTDTKHQELRNKFKDEFPKPAFAFDKPLIAPALTNNYGVIGTAFDYILRFFIEFHNKKKSVESTKWVSDISFNRLAKRFEPNSDKFSELAYRYKRAKENYEKFIESGKISNHLLADALFLAKLDLYIRIGVIAPDLFDENELDIQDLNSIYAALNYKDFIAKESCILNPTFGTGSLIVGGADADIILDDTIIDIKVTKHLKLERVYLNQTIGYYILSLIGGIDKVKNGKIKNIGIYFARHGFLWKFPLSKLGNEKKLTNFKKWFEEYFEQIRLKAYKENTEKLKILGKEIAKEKKLKSVTKKVKK